MWFLYLLAIIIAIIVDWFVATKFAEIAQMKGHEGNTYFWFTFILGIVGMLMVVALPTLEETKEENTKPSIIAPRTEVKADEWKCTCGKIHKNYEVSCVCGLSKQQAKANRDN